MVPVWRRGGSRSVSYQPSLYEKKTNYYKQQGCDDAKAKEMAAAVVNPPGYSEHNCGLAADLNSPEHTGLDEGLRTRLLSVALPARRGVRVHPALPQGGRGEDRDHLRALALALCGRGKRREDQRQRPVL